MANETLRYDIIVNAKASIQILREMSEAMQNNSQRVEYFSNVLIKQSKAWNVPLQQLLNTYRQLNAELSRNKEKTIFGNVGGQNIFNMSKGYLQAAEAAGRFSTNSNGVVQANTKIAESTKKAWGEFEIFGRKIDLVRTAFGTLEAIGIFTFIQTITNFFRGAVQSAREFEDSLYRLKNVEKELSAAGIAISMKGLQQGIYDLKKEFPIFSKEDLTGLVGNLAIKTKDLKYSEQQILDLAEAIAVLNVRSTEVETLDQTTGKVVTALLSGTTKGISGLGLQMSDMTIEAEAMAEGLLKAGEGVDDLTKQEKDLVKLNIVLKSVGGEIVSIQEYMNSSTGIIQQNTAAWKDLQAQVGTFLTGLVPLVSPVLKVFESGFIALKSIYAILYGIREIIPGIVAAWRELFTGSGIDGFIAKLKEIPARMKDMLRIKINDFFPQAPDSPLFDKLFGDLMDMPETETNPLAEAAADAVEDGQKLASAVADTEEKILDIMSDARDKRADIDEQYRRKIEDANRDHAQKMQDIARDVERKQDDALRDYNQKVEDINRDANEKIAEANRDAKQKEIDREREYQNKLRELRERFLFDLEDALRERDARQVLRLIRQYNMDKKNLEEKRKLDRQEAKKDLQQKLADIERERQQKLAAAQRELAEKQAEIALWAARERQDAQIALQRKLADAKLWHQRELQEYQQYLQRKLQELAKAIVKEYQLTAAGAQAIYSLLQGYFGNGGAISSMLAQGLTANLNSIVSANAGGGGGGGNLVSPTWAQAGFYGAAEGGTFVATRPTKVIFGEKGPEMASFTPLGRTGSDVGKVFGDRSLAGGQGGNINLRVSLSPNLVAEVIDSTLESVALHVERITREK